jgi:NAD(P)H-dependent nitrite reductase small subunit
MSWISLCQIDELTERKGKYVEIDGFQLAVFLVDGKVNVLDNVCPHAGGSLAEGEVDDECVACPWHQWTFRLADGKLRGAETVGVTHYPIRLLERDGQPTLVQADLPVY